MPNERGAAGRQPSRQCLPDHLSRIFIIPQSHELGMPELVGSSPFREVDADHDLRFHPDTGLHFLRREPLAPPSGFLLRQVGERTLRDLEPFDLGEYLNDGWQEQTSTDPVLEHQVFSR
jgi:hypothetical protein